MVVKLLALFFIILFAGTLFYILVTKVIPSLFNKG